MKTLRFTALFSAVALTCAAAAPSLSITEAASVAQQHLKERGLADSRFISSLVLEKSAVTSGAQFWYARWSESVKLEEKKTELGLRINMDGSLVRMVEGPNSKPTNHRSRSDRPSILDLK